MNTRNFRHPGILTSLLATSIVAVPPLTEILDPEREPAPKSLVKPKNAYVRDRWNSSNFVRREEADDWSKRESIGEKRLEEAAEKRAKKAAKRQANADKHAAVTTKLAPIVETEAEEWARIYSSPAEYQKMFGKPPRDA